jgi:hypothetical protein
MASQDKNGENYHVKTIHGRDRFDDGTDSSSSSSSNSSSLPQPLKVATPAGSDGSRRTVENKAVGNDTLVNQNPMLLLFNPNEKGTKKQKRCDYDSDDRSYDGLGLEYKRRNLPTTTGRDTFLPNATKFVDFDYHGSKEWGDRLLFEALQGEEIDALVGLATCHDVNFHRGKIDGRSERAKGRRRNVKRKDSAQSKAASPRSSTTNTTDSDDDPIFGNPQRRNPLLTVAYDGPPPASHIDYIQSSLRNHGIEPSGNYPGRRKSENERNQGNGTESTLEDSVAVATSMYLEECLSASLLPLAGLHVLRCRALEAMESTESEFCAVPVKSNVVGKHRRRLHKDNSQAYDLQPTAPHPITGEPVQLDLNSQIRWKEENSFEEWTLPPAEAILKLLEQGVLSNDLPYHFVPDASKSWMPENLPGANDGDHDSDRDETSNHSRSNDAAASPADGDDSRVSIWSKRYKVNPELFAANRELFDIFRS